LPDEFLAMLKSHRDPPLSTTGGLGR